MRYVITEYVEKAMKEVMCDKFKDGTFAGGILAECERELRSALEDWIFLGLQMGHKLSVIDEINLNRIDTKVETLWKKRIYK